MALFARAQVSSVICDGDGGAKGKGGRKGRRIYSSNNNARILVSRYGGNGGDEFELRRETKPIYLVSA